MELEMAKSRERFTELAEKRVTRVMKDIRLVGNLANRNNYQFDQQDAEKIVSAIEREVKALRSKFASSNKTMDVAFKL